MAPDPNSLLQFFLIIGLLGSVGGHIVTMLNLRRSQRREVSFTAEYASKEEIAEIKQDLKGLNQKWESTISTLALEMKHDLGQISANNELRAAKLHERIDKILEGVARLQGRNEGVDK
jgi:hypothetical protein